VLRAFAEEEVEPRFAVQGGEMDAVLRLVEAGTGVAVVPDLVFAGRPRLRRTVLTPALHRTVALARRADLTPTHAVRAFRETLLSFLADLSAGDGLPGDVQVLRRPDR
jgi:DNA-binding transcriptional LysR family regulator